MKTEITKSIKEVAEEAAKRLVKCFGGRAEVRTYGKFADVLFDTNRQCNYTDIINETSVFATMYGKRFNHVYLAGTVLLQYFD